MEIRIIEYGTADYEKMRALRIKALLEPIGIPASYIIPENEKSDVFIGALENKEVIGCCILTSKDHTTVQLRQMVVQPGQQGKGIGAAIINFAEQAAKDLGYKILMMHARDPAIDFYKKCGYEIIGEHFFEVGMGHHRMQKEL